MLSVVCWKWGPLFCPKYVNRLRAMLLRNLHVEHELVCVTDDDTDIDPAVRIVALPTTFEHTPRCRRRMQQYSREFNAHLGRRILSIDLDVVIVDDITPIVNRHEPLVLWKVGYAEVFSGSFVLFDAGVLDGLWQRFAADPEGYPASVQSHGVPSDQAMLNHYLKSGRPVPFWTEADGFVTYFGAGYERKAHHGIGARRPQLPPGARIVVLGSADKAVMDQEHFPWIREHWREEQPA